MFPLGFDPVLVQWWCLLTSCIPAGRDMVHFMTQNVAWLLCDACVRGGFFLGKQVGVWGGGYAVSVWRFGVFGIHRKWLVSGFRAISTIWKDGWSWFKDIWPLTYCNRACSDKDTHTHMCLHTHTHTHTHTRKHTNIRTHKHTHVNTHTYAQTQTHIHIDISASIYT